MFKMKAYDEYMLTNRALRVRQLTKALVIAVKLGHPETCAAYVRFLAKMLHELEGSVPPLAYTKVTEGMVAHFARLIEPEQETIDKLVLAKVKKWQDKLRRAKLLKRKT